MYAIIETGGKQYRVSPGEILTVERLQGNVGDTVKIDKVLLVGGKSESDVLVGTPYVAQATLEGEIVQQSRGDKLLVIKYRRRKGFRKTLGHRQEQTKLLITKISNGKGGQSEFDSAQKKQVLMKASIPSSAKKKAAAASAAPEAKKTKAPTTEKKTAAAPRAKKATSKKSS